MSAVLSVEHVSKVYQLGTIRAATIQDDLVRWWARLRRRPDPLSKVGGRRSRLQDGSFLALDDVSLTVNSGEAVGIIGRNGAGKSTLLKILSQITGPTTGSVRVRGRLASLLEVGTGFHPDLTGRENVFLNGAILGMSKAEIRQRLDEIIAFAELEDFVDTPVKRYSSGMYVRLAFAVAAHLEPEILIVDEVLAVGDAAFQEKCLGKMQSASGAGRTVLFVSHNMSAIQHLCSRAVLMRGGKVFADGNPNEIVGQYFADARSAENPDISKWEDRQGTGEARVVQLLAVDASGKPNTTFKMGDPIQFEFVVDVKEPLTDPRFGLCLHSATGEPMVDLQASHSGLKSGRLQGKVRVIGVVPDLPLYPGRYLLSPWVTDSASHGFIDIARFCSVIDISPAPGKFGDLTLDPKWGRYLVSSDWSIAPIRPEADAGGR
ncbi:MAG TPA: ABC transporter ATP-binding protein [Vicinamibacterales bacterium]|nr:ABC transporter ATP-binding protein [Vicinamibacterales bacterium]